MKNIFMNTSEGRLRTGWRILIFLVLVWAFSMSAFLLKPLLGDISRRTFVEGFSVLVIGIIAVAATAATYLARKFLDKKSLVSLGLTWNKTARADLLFGFLLSGLMAAGIFLLMLMFGLIEFNGINWHNPAVEDGAHAFITYMSVMSLGVISLLLLEMIFVGYWEELVFRGYIFQNMVHGLGIVIAIAVSCLIYGVIHYANPNATLLSSAIIIAFGWLRLYGYLSTKQLWLSMGMHIGWNFFQGPIFGYAASGHASATLIDQSPVADNWLSGGSFGPEGSVLIIPVLLLALLAMRLWTKNRDKINYTNGS